MRPAPCSTAKCADIVGFDTAKCSDSSPAAMGRSRSSCSTRRRVGSDSALNTWFTNLYLANHRTIVKRRQLIASAGNVVRETCPQEGPQRLRDTECFRKPGPKPKATGHVETRSQAQTRPAV